jgi:hypothetical protein
LRGGHTLPFPRNERTDAVGFELPRSEYDLSFDDTELAGLHIKVRAMTMGERFHVFFDLAPTPADSAEESKKKTHERAEIFTGHVLEWNIEVDGQPQPIDADVLLTVAEPEQIGVIMTAWAKGRTHVPAPLEQRSPGTSLSEIPMTVQESTSEPS